MSDKKKKLHSPFHLHIPNFVLNIDSSVRTSNFTAFQTPHRNIINTSESVYEPKLLLGRKDERLDSVVKIPKEKDFPKSHETTKQKQAANTLTNEDARKMKLYKELELLARNLKENTSSYQLKYLNYSLPKNSEHFTSFNLIEKTFQKLDKLNYYTVTHEGITYWCGSENYFVSLDEWQDQYKMFFKIIQIKTFLRFRLWKGYIVWLKTIKWQKFYAAKNVLENQLLIANLHLGEAILRLKKRIYEYHAFNLIHITITEEFHLFYFIERHMKIYENFVTIMRNFRLEAQKFLYDACTSSIIAEGYYPIDEILIYPSITKMREAMSYMDRAKKRTFCKLLANFLTYCDYLILNMLHEIIFNGFAALLNIADVHNSAKKPVENVLRRLTYFKRHPEFKAFFFVELILKPDLIEINPSEEVATFVLRKLTNLWLDAMKEFDNFTDDLNFIQYTKPSIMGRQEDKQTGLPPSLQFLLKTDTQYKANDTKIFDILTKSYKDIQTFILQYEEIRNDYKTDVYVKPLVLSISLNIDTFRNYIAHYHKNIDFVEKMNVYEFIGMIKLQQIEFKETISPVFRELLQTLENFLIKLAMLRIEAINMKSEEIYNTIVTVEPLSEYETKNKFNNINLSIDNLMLEVDVVHDMFMIMKEFQIPVDDAKKESYMDCEDLVHQCRDFLIDKLKFEDESASLEF